MYQKNCLLVHLSDGNGPEDLACWHILDVYTLDALAEQVAVKLIGVVPDLERAVDEHSVEGDVNLKVLDVVVFSLDALSFVCCDDIAVIGRSDIKSVVLEYRGLDGTAGIRHIIGYLQCSLLAVAVNGEDVARLGVFVGLSVLINDGSGQIRIDELSGAINRVAFGEGIPHHTCCHVDVTIGGTGKLIDAVGLGGEFHRRGAEAAAHPVDVLEVASQLQGHLGEVDLDFDTAL